LGRCVDGIRSVRGSNAPCQAPLTVVSYDGRAALLVVDLQNDFADPAGALAVVGAEGVITVANREIDAAVAAGATVAFSQDWHPEHTPHFARDGGIWPVHCVANTWGAEFVPALHVRGAVIRKGSNGEDGYSAFTMRDVETGETRPTELAELLGRAISRVVVVGLATDYCVKATALDALALGFETVVLSDGVRAVNLQPADGEAALASIRDAGGIII